MLPTHTSRNSTSFLIAISFLLGGIAHASPWIPTAPLPIEGRLNTCAVGLDGVLFVIGGFGYPPVHYFQSCLRLNVSTNAWTAVASLPQSRDALACAVLDGNVYAVGGESGEYPFTLTSVVRLEAAPGDTAAASSSRWTSAGNLTSARQSHGAAVLGGTLYAAGGIDANDALLSSAEQYDAATETWSTIAPMKTARYYFGLAGYGNMLWAIGGLDANFSVLASVETFDPSTGAWTERAKGAGRLPVPRERFGIAVFRNSIVVLGGCHDDQNRVNGLTNSSIALGGGEAATWAAAATLPRANGEMGVAVVGDALFIVGGGLAFSRNTTFKCAGQACFA